MTTYEAQRAVGMTYGGQRFTVIPLTFRFDVIEKVWLMRARLHEYGEVIEYVLTGCKFDD